MPRHWVPVTDTLPEDIEQALIESFNQSPDDLPDWILPGNIRYSIADPEAYFSDELDEVGSQVVIPFRVHLREQSFLGPESTRKHAPDAIRELGDVPLEALVDEHRSTMQACGLFSTPPDTARFNSHVVLALLGDSDSQEQDEVVDKSVIEPRVVDVVLAREYIELAETGW